MKSKNDTDAPALNGPFVNAHEFGLLLEADGKTSEICSFFSVLGEVYDFDGAKPAYGIKFTNKFGQSIRREIPKAILNDDKALHAKLTNFGVSVPPNNWKKRIGLVRTYMHFNCPASPTFVRTRRNGWMKMPDKAHVYVLGGEVYGSESNQFAPFRAYKEDMDSQKRGSLAAWLTLMHIVENDAVPILALCAAFAAPLLAPLRLSSIPLFIYGPSSIGKTIVLKLAAALYGPSDSVLTWSGTNNGIEASVLEHRDTVCVIDEVSQASGKQFGELAYRLTNSASRQRATAAGHVVETEKPRVVLLSAGETAPLEHMEDQGVATTGGHLARLVAVPAADKYGVWSSLGTYQSGAAKSDDVMKRLANVYGVAGHLYCKRIVPEIKDIALGYNAVSVDLEVEILGNIDLDATSGVPSRVLKNFALFAYAGLLARAKGVVPFTDAQVMVSVKRGFALWHDNHMLQQPSKDAYLLGPVKLFFQSNRGTKIKGLAEWSDVHDGSVAGFEYTSRKGEEYFLVYPSYFAKHLCGDHRLNEVLAALKVAGYLHEGPRGVPTKQVHLPNSGKQSVSFYAIRQSILHD